jgi:hypothetical protein
VHNGLCRHDAGMTQVCAAQACCLHGGWLGRTNQLADYLTASWLAGPARLAALRPSLHTPTCTNTSPGPRPSSSLAGTRESEHPILQPANGPTKVYDCCMT